MVKHIGLVLTEAITYRKQKHSLVACSVSLEVIASSRITQHMKVNAELLVSPCQIKYSLKRIQSETKYLENLCIFMRFSSLNKVKMLQ